MAGKSILKKPKKPAAAQEMEVDDPATDQQVPTDAGSVPQNGGEEEGKKTSPGKRPAEKGGGTPAKRKKKASGFQQPKNALMQLNELKPGLKYEFEDQQGSPHDPIFVVSVEVNGQKYIGKGNSKQLAKHAAAEAALASFVQFRNMPEAMHAMSKRISNSDFAADTVENEASIFNKFDREKNGAGGLDSSVIMQCKLHSKLNKVITEADKKNPVMLLNELRPGLVFNPVRENPNIPSQRFVMSVTVDGETFEGVGQNKKAAKAAAARCVLNKRYNVNFNVFPLTGIPMSDVNLEIFNFPQSIADKMAKSISATFDEVMSGDQEHAKWKVLAGIVMTKDEQMEDMQVIGIGTGTYHLKGEHMSLNGGSINDCHAEIIARRCFKDFLYTQLELHLEGEGDQSVFEKKAEGKFALKPHHKFHMFISTSPCGDARIFSIHDKRASDAHSAPRVGGLLRTKIESGEGTIPVAENQPIQQWQDIKNGRMRYLTMSCSDKIASWNVLGIQGSLLNHFMDPIYLHSLVFGRLFHPEHMYRAVCGRLQATSAKLPPPFALNKPMICSTTTLETRQVTKAPVFSINWTTGLGRPEIIIAKTGKLMESGQVSRLAKRSFFQRFSNLYSTWHPAGSEGPTSRIYAAMKSNATEYHAAKMEMKRAFQGAGLGYWVKKPVEQDEFELMF